ncbi:hypothetical protein [Vibrio owensii]|uniref:hypothetical protein n=1 Tax=Vibrio harveyi group TaxID=717610 RepID=UPI003CC53BD1
MDKIRQIIKRIIYKHLSDSYNGPADLIALDIMTNIYKHSQSRNTLFEDDELFQISLHKNIGLADLQEDETPGEYRSYLNTLLVSSALDTQMPVSLDKLAEVAAKQFQIIEK